MTNLATGSWVSVVNVVMSKDLRLTDNGDGTLTVVVFGTGNTVVSGSDGKAIARNPGQTRLEFVVDHGGTPADPSDDSFVEFLGLIKESTGRNDDLCAAMVAELT